jgi:hypothetical protein
VLKDPADYHHKGQKELFHRGPTSLKAPIASKRPLSWATTTSRVLFQTRIKPAFAG